MTPMMLLASINRARCHYPTHLNVCRMLFRTVCRWTLSDDVLAVSGYATLAVVGWEEWRAAATLVVKLHHGYGVMWMGYIPGMAVGMMNVLTGVFNDSATSANHNGHAIWYVCCLLS